MRCCEGLQHTVLRQRDALDLDGRDFDLAAAVGGVAPHALALEVQQHGQSGKASEVVRISVQLNLDAARKVLARLINEHMPARYQAQPVLALEEEAAGPVSGRCASKVPMRVTLFRTWGRTRDDPALRPPLRERWTRLRS
jgi:hypothetical protein